MKWLIRCWLAAWGVWLWFGVRLYHELPRDLGPTVCKIPLEKGWWVVGFFDDKHQIVVYDRQLPRRYAVFDAMSGTIIKDFEPRTDMNQHAASRWARRLRRGQERSEDKWVTPWRVPWEWRTVAIRDHYGRVVEREWAVHWKDHESADGALVADNQGTVHRRATVNWPLLVLCQTILALPLVLLWALLRWRRKKKNWSASQAAPSATIESTNQPRDS